MLKKLFCHHDNISLIKKDEWNPTFHTSNGLDDEDERILVFRCDECNKRIVKTQIKSHGSIINFKEVV